LTGTRPLAFGDGVFALRAYRASHETISQDPRVLLTGIVLDVSREGVLVGWSDGGEDLYRGMAARWCLRRMHDGMARELFRPGAVDVSPEYSGAAAAESLEPEPGEEGSP